MKRSALTFAVLIGSIVLSVIMPSHGRTVLGLTESNALFAFDSASPDTLIIGPTPISGLTAGYDMRGIDFRPATGQLYGLGKSGTQYQLYVVNPLTAAAAPLGSPVDLGATANGDDLGFDFNPVVDRVRMINRSGGNFRLNPDAGALTGTDTTAAFVVGDTNFGTAPLLEGLAYTNNVAGAATTTLFGYDYDLDILVRVGGANGTPSPNGGGVTTIGASGISASGTVGFDVAADGMAYLQDKTRFLTMDLTTGVVTLVGTFNLGDDVNDIAAVSGPQPKPSTSVNGSKKFQTESAKVTLKGRSTGAIPAAVVEVKVGKKSYKPASGAKKWTAKNVRLKKGRNKVLVRVTDLFGTQSRPVVLKITRI